METVHLDERLERIRAQAQAAAQEVVAPKARSADEQGRFDREVISELGRRGLLRVPFAPRFGGADLGELAMALVYEELGAVDSSVRGCVTVQVGLVGQCIADHGSDDQKALWLPKLIDASVLGCYCLTEPEAGSDAKSIATKAERTSNGWRLEGVKHWITNGGVAELAIVFAATGEGITAFLVPTDSPGFHREKMPGKELGHRGSDHALIRLQGVEVPNTSILGEVGRGLAVAAGALNHGRLGVAAGAVGILRACLEACVDFARTRRQFGQRIGDFEMVQASLADMAVDLAAGRLLVRQAASLADQGRDNSQEVSMAKLFSTEAASRAASQAVVLHGARGYSTAYPVERFMRDAKGMEIYEGTSHIQRVIIARRLLGRDTSNIS